jgi:hypothetical protein
MEDISEKFKSADGDSPQNSTPASSRRRVLQALGGTGALLATGGSASAAEHDDEPEEPDADGDVEIEDGETETNDDTAMVDEAFSRFSDQVTDGTYVIVDEVAITTPEGGFVSIHIARPEEGVADVGFINPEDGLSQNAAATIIGYSEWLEPGVHENVCVPIFEDTELDAVPEDMDRLEEPTVLVSLAHVDSNENQEWDFYDEGDEDPAYGFTETPQMVENAYAPPGDRPSDIAAVVPLENNAGEFQISR